MLEEEQRLGDDTAEVVASNEPVGGKPEREADGIVFDRVPMSPEAKALTEHLLGRFLEHEQRTKPRQRGRGPGRMAHLEQAIGRFAGGLAKSVDDGERLLASFPSDHNAYAKDGGGQRLPVTRTAALAAYDALAID